MGIFGTAHGWGRAKKVPSSLKSVTDILKPSTVISYLKKIKRNIYESRDKPPEFC